MSDNSKSDPAVSGLVSVTDVLGLGKAAEKLSPAAIEVVKAISGGLGRLYNPASIFFDTVAQGAANRHVALADAKAFSAMGFDDPDVVEAMKRRILGSEYRRQQNIIAAEQEALAIAQDNKAAETHDIDPGFAADWTEGVKDVSDETVRHLWAEVLAYAPTVFDGRVSKPVVDFLKQLDASLADELTELNEESFYTMGVMPVQYSGISDIATEIGMATQTRVQSVEVLDGLVLLECFSPGFLVVEIGARARQLARIVAPPVDLDVSKEHFCRELPNWLATFAVDEDVKDMGLSISTLDKQAYDFVVKCVAGEMMLVPEHEKARSVSAIMKMGLGEDQAAEELRRSLLDLSRVLTLGEIRNVVAVDRRPM